MDIFICLFATIYLGILGGYALYLACKPYKYEENDFMNFLGTTEIFFIELFVEFLIWITKRLFPEPIHMKMFRVIAFLYGGLMFAIVILIWTFFYQ